MRIELPISKSIANRLLILQAIHRDGLLTVSADMPDDVQLLHHALTTLHNASNSSQSERPIGGTPSYSPSGRPIAAQAASRSKILVQDFGNCPDLYPAVALTCERLGIKLHATGIESLPIKESDRLRAVAEHRTDADHRMAMALLIAGYEVDDTACISKSYPQFIEQFQRINSIKVQ